MDYDKTWSLLGSAAVLIIAVIVVFVLFILFMRGDTYRYLRTVKYNGFKPYYLPQGGSVRINRNKKFKTDIEETIVSEDFGYKDIILTSPVNIILYFPRRKK